MNPVEEARAFKKYTSEFGWGGESELARIISRSQQYVSNRIQLLKLPNAIIDQIYQNRLKVSHALEIVNLDEKEQKIINEGVVRENLTVRDIREFTRHSKLNKGKIARNKTITDELDDNYANTFRNAITDANNDSIRQKNTILQKAQLCLRISLYRLDSLIHESDEKLKSNGHSEVNDILMQFRLKIHSMMDDNIRAMTNLRRHGYK